MSTRAYIFLEKKDKTIDGVYCHSDGYLNYLGETLNEYYTDIEKVKELISLGDLSFLGAELTPCETVERFGFDGMFTEQFEKLSEDEQERLRADYLSDKHTRAYHRDRREELNIYHSQSLETLRKEIKDGFCMIQYFYIFRNNKWYWTDYSGKRLKVLKNSLRKLAYENE